MSTAEALRASIKTILKHSTGLTHPADLRWTVQGFGMLRCYLDPDKKYRLNIWDSTFAVPGVSTIHDHPWHFQSWIINGEFRNVRFYEVVRDLPLAVHHECMTIKTGEVGGPVGSAKEAWLRPQPVEVYKTGDTYYQRAQEIHKSVYDDGTVTLNERKRVGDGEHARVFWPYGQDWVDAKPREATRTEVEAVTLRALEIWQ